MLYIEECLLKGEKIAFVSRPHWIVFGPSLVIMLLALLIWGYMPSYFGRQLVFPGLTFIVLFSWMIAAVGVFMLLKAVLFFTTSEFSVTNRRVVMKLGWLNRNAVEVFLQRIEALNVSQSFLGRLLNYGTVVVIGTGGTADYYPNVPDPLNFHRKVQEQMNALMDTATKRDLVD